MSEAQRILVVEDEADIAELLAYNLNKEGYTVKIVASGEAAVKAAQSDLPI